MADKPKTVGEVVMSAAGYLAGRHGTESRPIAEHLMARLLNCRALELPLHKDRVLSEKQLESMRRGTRRA